MLRMNSQLRFFAGQGRSRSANFLIALNDGHGKVVARGVPNLSCVGRRNGLSWGVWRISNSNKQIILDQDTLLMDLGC